MKTICDGNTSRELNILNDEKLKTTVTSGCECTSVTINNFKNIT